VEGGEPRVFLAERSWKGIHGQPQTRAAIQRAADLTPDSASQLHAVCQGAQEAPPESTMNPYNARMEPL
jgi:hypothetical protein